MASISGRLSAQGPGTSASVGKIPGHPLRTVVITRFQGSRRAACRAGNKDPAAQLVEAVATLAIQSRLKSFADVKFDVEANGFGLLAGRVDRARMTGLGWESPLGLSARLLDVSVGSTALDYPALLTEQRVKLSNQPQGAARCLFDEADFGRFLTHPLVMKAAAKAVRGSAFIFDGDSVVVHAPGSQGPAAAAQTGAAAAARAAAAPAAAATGAAGLDPSQPWLRSQSDSGPRLQQGPTIHPPVMHPLNSTGSRSTSPGGSLLHPHNKQSEITGLGMDEAIDDPYFNSHAAGSAVNTGYITCTGTWRGQKYSLTLQPWGGPASAGGGAKPSVLVHARHMPHATSAHLASEAGAGSSTDMVGGHNPEEAADEEAVSLELSFFFSNLMIDLQGAELTFASMALLAPTNADVVNTSRACGVRYPGGQAAVAKARSGSTLPGVPAGSNVAAVQDAVAGIANLVRANVMSNQYPHNDAGRHATPTGPWLDLKLELRVREFPPLNLQF